MIHNEGGATQAGPGAQAAPAGRGQCAGACAGLQVQSDNLPPTITVQYMVFFEKYF